jgi:predicted DNA-binding antitoxin AbrB/MazE fold protein
MAREVSAMARTIEAVYENGVFRPLQPVKLEDGQRVQVYLPYEPGSGRDWDPETKLRQTQELFAGLSENDASEIERLILDRCRSRGQARGE